MAKETFDQSTTDEKFKAIRDDIRTLGAHASQNQRDIAVISRSLAELRQEIQKLTAVLSEQSRKA